jgi:hypothetical protein
MFINKTNTIATLVYYNKPIIHSLEYMDSINSNQINTTQYELFVAKELDNIKKLLSNKENFKSTINTIEKSFSVGNLKKHNLIQVDDSNGRIDFVDYIDGLFRALQSEYKIKPITNRVFVQHNNNLNEIINDSYKFDSLSDNDKELFFEDLRYFLKKVKQDFEKNITTITSKAKHLSSYLNDDIDSSINKQQIMNQIIELCDKYIEPFFKFLSTSKNKNGFVNNLVKLKIFFEKKDMNIEEQEVSRFIMSYSSYHQDIKLIYEQINEYRRKGQKDLILFNAFEAAYLDLDKEIMSLQDGKLKNNYLDTSDFHLKYNVLDNIKTNNVSRVETSINYTKVIDHFDQIEDTLLIDLKIDDAPIITDSLDQGELTSLMLKDEYARNKGTMNSKLTAKISKVINVNSHNILKKDNDIDVMHKLHVILEKNIENYKPFYVLYAYTNIRKRIKDVRVGYNIRKTIVSENKIYRYRPIYSQGVR